MGAGAGLVAGITTAFAAADAATVAAIGISLTTVFEITTAVGVGLSVIGAVTKNKVLSDVGMGLGIIGGIGSLAGAAGAFGVSTAASTADAALGAGAGAAGMGAETGATFADSLMPATTGTIGGAIESGAWDATSGLGAINSIASGSLDQAQATSALNQPPPSDLTTLQATSQNAANPGALPSSIDSKTGAITNAAQPTAPGTDISPTPTVPAPTGPGTGAASSSNAPFDVLGKTTPPTSPDAVTELNTPYAQGITDTGISGATATASDSGGVGGVIQGLLDFAKKNPVVALGTIQAGGSFLSGLTSTLTPAQVAYYNANAANNQAQANLTAQQTANLAMPKATANLTPVTGQPSPLVPTTNVAGLINNMPPPRLSPVTGVPA